MAIVGNWIPTGNDQARLSGQLRGAVQQLAAAAAQLAAISNTMAQMVAADNFATVETYYGLQAGDGQAMHDLVGSASAALQGGDVQGLLQRLA